MPLASSVFWIAGFMLSALLGSTLRIWTWGPTLLCFAAATAFAIPQIWRDGLGKVNLIILTTGLITTVWFAGRAWFSPVKELALIDLTLVTMAVSTFIVLQNAYRDNRTQVVIIGGIAILLCTNLAVMAAQYRDINYNLVIPHVLRMWPAGLFRHYSHCASFLIMSSLLLAGFSIKSSWPMFARILLLVIALAGLAAVFITKSRSGILGAGGGVFALIVYWLLTGKRDDRKWCGIGLLIAPIVLFIIVAIALSVLQTVESSRNEGSDLINMLDNSIRLYFYGIAFSCITLHPLIGGGSRSFSWENYRFWDVKEMGALGSDPEHVHNEFVQVFTDYGIIGAICLTSFICAIWILCTFRSFSSGEWSKRVEADAWRMGGIAAFIGIFIQSNFEGILRTAPGAIMLAVCLAAANYDGIMELSKSGVKHLWARRISLTTVSLAAILLMALFGWKGSLVSIHVWRSVFQTSPITKERKIESYTRALEHWKLESLLGQRGLLRYELAFEKSAIRPPRELLEQALEDYQSAAELHPYSPVHTRNAAAILGLLGETEKASAHYEKAIRLQGGMEAAFKSQLYYAEFLLKAGIREQYTGSSTVAQNYYKRSAEILDSIPLYVHGMAFYDLQKSLLVNSANLLEDEGQFQAALEKYDTAIRIHQDADAAYFAANMLSSAGQRALSEQRPADALRLFLEAETRYHQSARSTLLTDEARNQILAELRKNIVALEQASHRPSEKIRFE